MYMCGEVETPCSPPISWLEDAQLVAYKLASGEYENKKGLLLLEQQSPTKSPLVASHLNLLQQRQQETKRVPGNTSVKIRQRRNGNLVLPPTIGNQTTKPGSQHVNLGRGKMYETVVDL